MFMRNIEKYVFFRIFELMKIYFRDIREIFGDKRLKKGKDCIFLV